MRSRLLGCGLGLLLAGGAAGVVACSDDTPSATVPVDTTTTTRVSGSGTGSGEAMAAALASCFGAARPAGWKIIDDANVSVPAGTIADVASQAGFVTAVSKDPAGQEHYLVNFEKNCRITSAPAPDGTDHVQILRDAGGYQPAPATP